MIGQKINHDIQSKIKPSSSKQRDLSNQSRPVYSPSTIHSKAPCSCGGGCPKCQGVQTKLKIGSANDHFELEADRIADQVMRMPEPKEKNVSQGKINTDRAKSGFLAGNSENSIAQLQQPELRSQIRPWSISTVKPSTKMPTSVSRSVAGSGTTLPQATRERTESFFNADFGKVRVHTGDNARKANQDINAHAFSVGNNIVLNKRSDINNEHLIAHELTHLLQAPAPSHAPPFSSPNDPAEREAHAAAESFSKTSESNSQFSALTQTPTPRSALVHCDARHPSATVFDGDYLLYELNATDYDHATQHYYLSPWDRTHLRRVNGLYIMEASGTSLVTPPEIRAATGGRGVLITLTRAELFTLYASTGPSAVQFAIDIANDRFGVSVPSVTLSNGANEDFTVSTLPGNVASTLSSPLLGVSSRDTAGVDAARRSASTVRQNRTLSLSNTRGEEPPMRELERADQMDVNTLFGRDDSGRAAWYVNRLGPLQAQIHESAQNHQLPMQLLATVILNEQADINWADVLQSSPNTFNGSLGIAQIQITTARSDNLVDLPPGSHRTGWARSDGHAHSIDAPSMVDMGERLRAGQLLQVPQIAVEAAAREIEILLNQMAANHSSPWQITHNFTASGTEGDAIYTHVGSGHPISREGALARAISGAYNSPNVITATDTSVFPNANIHGDNAQAIALDLFRFRLFRTT